MTRDLKNKFRKNAFIANLFILGFLAYIAKFTLNVFLARNLSPALYGDYSLGYKLLFLLAGLITVGTQGGALFFYSRFVNEKKDEYAQGFVRWNFKIWLYATVLSSLILISVFTVLFLLGNFNSGSTEQIHVSIFMAIFAPTVAASTVLATYLLVYGDYLFSQSLTGFSYSVIFLVLFVFCIKLLHWHVNDWSLVLITMVTTFLAFLATLIVTMIKSEHWRKINIIMAIKQKLTAGRSWFIYSVQICLSNFILSAVFFVDLLLLELIHPDENSVGKFAAISALGSIIYIVPYALYKNLRKNVSVYLSDGRTALLQKDLNQLSKITFFYSFALVVIISMFSQFFLSLFGHSYTDVQLPLIVVLVGASIQNFAMPGVLLLEYGGFPKEVICLNVFILASLIILGGIFIY
ncbi:MAG: oligosaccharide flippase family protein, partial [bacterium]|nr:oligosaccharide flippase family protein [bacterium]